MAGLAGFMPMPGPGATYGGNWSQDWGDVMNTLVAAEQANARQNYGNSPMGDSFLRRFAGASPLGMPSMEPQVAEPTPDLAALQGALAQAARESGQFIPNAVTRQTGVPYAGPMIDASEGALRGQPWYDEYLAAAQANPGGRMPMVMGSGGTPRDMDKAAAYRANRDADMQSRRNAVQQQAISKSEQRAVRMGDMSENQQYFNELARLQGALGGSQHGGGQNLMTGVMFGPEAMVGMDRNANDLQINRDRLNFAGSPIGMMAASIANGQPISLPQIQQMMSGAPVAEQLLQASGGDWEKFKTMANAAGMSGQETLDAWARLTGEQKGGPQQPGILDIISGAGTSYGWDWNPYD